MERDMIDKLGHLGDGKNKISANTKECVVRVGGVVVMLVVMLVVMVVVVVGTAW